MCVDSILQILLAAEMLPAIKHVQARVSSRAASAWLWSCATLDTKPTILGKPQGLIFWD